MVSRTDTRTPNRPGVSANAQEFDLDLSDVDNDDAPERATVLVDYGHREIVVDGAGQEWRFEVVDEAAGRVDQRGGDDYPTWVGGVLKYVGVDERK